MGLPVATAASRSCCCLPGRSSEEREARSPLMLWSFAENEDGDVGLVDEVDGVMELGVALGVGVQGGLGAGELRVEDGGLFALDFDALGEWMSCRRRKRCAHAFEDGDGVCRGGRRGTRSP